MSNPKDSNGRVQRRSLGDEIERLHDLLDGLNGALEGVIANAVKDAVGSVVREAVTAAVREVLGSPELLKVALKQHEPVQPQAEPATVKPNRRPTREGLVEVCGRLREWAGEKLVEFGRVMSTVWTYCVVLLVCAGDWFFGGIGALAGRSLTVCNRMTVWAGRVWRFRRTCAVAVSIGLGCGAVAYLSGPLVSAIMCVVGGAGLTVSALILVPLGRLLLSDCRAGA
jgi:hypothetical protein